MHLDNDLKVTITVKDIVESLKKNRDEHKKEYDEAFEKYFLAVQKRLKAFVKSAKKKELRSYNVGLQPPVNRTEEYDKIINMFNFAKNDTVELTQMDVDQIFNDTFSWATQAKNSAAFYNSPGVAFASSMNAY